MNASHPPEFYNLPDVFLRRWEPGDAPALLAAVTESFDQLHPWMPWAAEKPTLDDEEGFIRTAQESWRTGEAFLYGGFDPVDGSVLGSFGLHLREGAVAPDIGYWLHPAYTGRGIATRVSLVLEEFALRLPGIEQVEIHCDERNEASAAVARRLGYRLAEIRDGEPDALGRTRRMMIWIKTAAH